jgi:hypothetical protein
VIQIFSITVKITPNLSLKAPFMHEENGGNFRRKPLTVKERGKTRKNLSLLLLVVTQPWDFVILDANS